MLNDIVDDSKFSNTMRRMYTTVSNNSSVFDFIFEEIYNDISNVYNAEIGDDGKCMYVTVNDETTSETVKDYIDTAIDKLLKQHNFDIVPAIAFRVVYGNKIFQIIKRY